MSKMKMAPEVRIVPKQSDNFKELNEKNCRIIYNQETGRFALYRDSQFAASDQNLDSIVYHSNRYYGTTFNQPKTN